MTDPAAPAPVQPEKANLFDDFLDIFATPSKVFARRVASNPMVPFLVVSVLLVGMIFVNRNMMAPITDAELQKTIQKAMESNPQMTPEVVNRMRGFMEMSVTVGSVVGVPIALLLLGLVTWIVGKVVGGTLSYGTALMISSFAWIPRVVEAILASVQGLVLDTSRMTSRYDLSLGVARVLDHTTTPAWLLGVAGRVDLITLWVTALFAVGLVAAGKVPREKRVLAGVVMWVVGGIIPVIGALRAG